MREKRKKERNWGKQKLGKISAGKSARDSPAGNHGQTHRIRRYPDTLHTSHTLTLHTHHSFQWANTSQQWQIHPESTPMSSVKKKKKKFNKKKKKLDITAADWC